jgi:cytidine deaminase
MTRRDAMAVIGAASMGAALAGLPLFGQGAVEDVIRQRLPHFKDQSVALLRRVMEAPAYSGRIEAADAETLAKNEGLSVDKLMVAMLPLAQSYSRAPISNFYVGVVVRGESGALYTGANIELPGQCLGFAVHAEQSALANAYMHNEHSVSALAVGGAPCGHCRQFIDEMSPNGEILILTPRNEPRKLSVILPEAFGPAALGMDHGALPIQKKTMELSATTSDPLAQAALEAARNAYAPYSKSPSGIAVKTSGGKIYRGSYIESVAFNPSLSPLQVALAATIAAREEYSAISAVTLCELQNATISQRPVTEAALRAIAPGVKLEVVAARA